MRKHVTEFLPAPSFMFAQCGQEEDRRAEVTVKTRGKPNVLVRIDGKARSESGEPVLRIAVCEAARGAPERPLFEVEGAWFAGALTDYAVEITKLDGPHRGFVGAWLARNDDLVAWLGSTHDKAVVSRFDQFGRRSRWKGHAVLTLAFVVAAEIAKRGLGWIP